MQSKVMQKSQKVKKVKMTDKTTSDLDFKL